jgi:hypothetical protein
MPMRNAFACAVTLASILLAAPLYAGAAPTPRPFPTPDLPNKPLHATVQVEVKKRGQVVRVAHGSLSGDHAFDIMILGNAMQMWIRRPDGTAETGLYRVSYNYDPKTHQVQRVPELLQAGGNWANKPGAATQIVGEAQKEVRVLEARIKAEQKKKEEEEAKHLPDINSAVRRAMATPAPTPQP